MYVCNCSGIAAVKTARGNVETAADRSIRGFRTPASLFAVRRFKQHTPRACLSVCLSVERRPTSSRDAHICDHSAVFPTMQLTSGFQSDARQPCLGAQPHGPDTGMRVGRSDRVQFYITVGVINSAKEVMFSYVSDTFVCLTVNRTTQRLSRAE